MEEIPIDFTTVKQDGKNGPFSDKIVGIISPQCYLTSTILELVS